MRIAGLLVLCACELPGTPLDPVDNGTLPYHPLVFELDLSILAYQLHGQSMVWPVDPFYEEHDGGAGTPRPTMMQLVRGWAARTGEAQLASGIADYRGPGVLTGLPDNTTHDPLVYDYARIHPWSFAITNNLDQWVEYQTPDAITRRIRDVYVSARRIGDAAAIEVTQLVPGRIDSAPDAEDVLCAFEGGTGDRDDVGRPASFSLVGFVLARDTPANDSYDVHVAFRGSRSGDATRAALDALDSDDARGNPDWITDLAWDHVNASEITSVGAVHQGFARAMRDTLPGLRGCLAKIAELRAGAPTHIHVTGHSLGGGLAQMFASAVLLGDAVLPEATRAWPWPQLKLVSFSAPRAGDFTWASALSGGALESPFYDPSPLETVDADARVVLDPSIVARLHDPARPAGFRVLVSTDPITTTKLAGEGTHVGTTVYVNGRSFIDWIGPVTVTAHEPEVVRDYMLDHFADDRIPPVAIRYRSVSELVPGRVTAARGSPLEMEKLAAGLRAYYVERGLYFDQARFDRDFELRFAIERGL